MTSRHLDLLPPPPVHSVDSRRLLVTSARRRETAAAREKWKQHQAKIMTSQLRLHPLSAPPDLRRTSSHSAVLSGLRNSLMTPNRYNQNEDNSPPKVRQPQFPLLEQEVNKRNLTKRLPYHVPLHVRSIPKGDYPVEPTTYHDVFFLNAAGGARREEQPGSARGGCKSTRQERFFIHPEWSSETVSWKRFVHRSTPDQFRYSWM